MHVTVVMPTLNQAEFIDEAITSALQQDHAALDLLVVDGQSTDGTLHKLAQWQARHPHRLRWVSAPDSGPAQALNVALQAAHGDVLGWLNSDDLYTPGAVTRAVAALTTKPKWQMVYGNARHVDLHGADLGPYPTQPPPRAPATLAPETMAQGCFICQPTVFMRRSALQAVGPLDETLRIAFDMEWWLRWLRAWPGQIGFVKPVQAHSRLHSGGLTLSQRRRGTTEAMQVLARHLGHAPAQWILSWLDEACARHPHSTEPGSVVDQLHALLHDVTPTLATPDRKGLQEQLSADMRLRLSHPQAQVDVSPDGWVSGHTQARLRWQPDQPRTLRLSCHGAWPLPGQLQLRISTPSGHVQELEVNAQAPFTLEFKPPAGQPAGFASWDIDTSDHFVPAKTEAGSKDRRKLSFRVEGMVLA